MRSRSRSRAPHTRRRSRSRSHRRDYRSRSRSHHHHHRYHHRRRWLPSYSWSRSRSRSRGRSPHRNPSALGPASIRQTGLQLGPGFAYDPINNAWIQVNQSNNKKHNLPEEDNQLSWESDDPDRITSQSTRSKLASTLMEITDKLGEISAARPKSPQHSLSKSSVPAPSPEKSEYQKEMERYYEQNAPDVDRDPTCAPIAAHLIPPLEKWFWSPYPADDIKRSIEHCKRPENALAVRQNWINEEMYLKIGSKGKTYDQKLRYINNSLSRSAQPATVVWDKLAAMEAACKENGDVNAGNQAVLSVKDKVFNITEMREHMDLSLKLAGVTNVQLFQHHRYRLKSFLN